MTELWQRGAKELADLIHARTVSSREVVEAHLNRIEQLNSTLNAVTVTLEESALQLADEADKRIRKGQFSPLSGVPFTVKENQDVAGSATTLGLIPLKNAIAAADAPHIAELKRAGGIPIARTNMPEFGMRWHTTNGIYGATINPRNETITPGGSSGGDAAAVASGMVPLGIGNDGAGSLRWPAQCCGIAALKPSHGRVPVTSGVPPQPIPFAFQLLGAHGPMARSVEDLELAIQHMCSAATGDPWHVNVPLSWPDANESVPIGVVSGLDADPAVEQALARAKDTLQDAGYPVQEAALPALDRASEVYTQIMDRFGRLTAEPQRAPVGVISEGFDQFWAALNGPWKNAMGQETHDPMMERGVIYARWQEMMRETPVLLAPIATMPPWRVGADLDERWVAKWLTSLRTVVVVNLLGLPSVAVPVGDVDGVPQVIQVIGPRWREDWCLAVARHIEVPSPVCNL